MNKTKVTRKFHAQKDYYTSLKYKGRLYNNHVKEVLRSVSRALYFSVEER